MGYRFNSRTELRVVKRVFSNGNSNQRRAIFLLVGREHANVGMEKLDTYN